jgi:hypothetical protein
MRTSEPKNAAVTVLLKASVREALQRSAARQNRPVSNYIATLIEAQVADRSPRRREGADGPVAAAS